MDESRRRTLDALQTLNQAEAELWGDPETITRIAQYELAYRMQIAVPEVMDISKEKPETLEMYGAKPGEAVPSDLTQQRETPARANG